jgi:protein O-GlcNAcase/histone acetyltransferase
MCGVVEGFYGRPWTTDQRKELFRNLKLRGLNTYMYAPKDDFKHRAYWRELYSVEEAEQLSGLIAAATESGITFVYALSPGLDIIYSSPKEIACLKRKLEQVSQFGCEAFALLFDDIEPEISQTDKEVFQSFAQAQVSVTNEIYQNLNQPVFIFCPTEYCSARASPSVRNSEYLNTIGAKLLPGIDIMWTGSKVITKVITVESIRELESVLRRPPLIWDNLHANDYDQKRIFLGPYSGRSTDLVSHLRGVLTNPNCEYEANFIPIHTIAQWSKCNTDAKSLCSEVTADIRLETESESGESDDIPPHVSPDAYHPRRALMAAIADWLPEFYKNKTAHDKVVAPLASVVANLTVPPPAMLEAATAKSMDKTCDEDSAVALENTFVPLTKELVNSLVDPPVILNPILEPMDCVANVSAPPSPKGAADTIMSSQATVASDSSSSGRDSSLEEMQTDPSDLVDNRLTIEDLSLLVDLFYLPFEHGTQGLLILNEFQWLRSNSHVMQTNEKDGLDNEVTPDACAIKEWKERSLKFDEMCQAVNRLFNRLTFIKNRTLFYDFNPYVSDLRAIITQLNSYIQKLGKRKSHAAHRQQ